MFVDDDSTNEDEAAGPGSAAVDGDMRNVYRGPDASGDAAAEEGFGDDEDDGEGEDEVQDGGVGLGLQT